MSETYDSTKPAMRPLVDFSELLDRRAAYQVLALAEDYAAGRFRKSDLHERVYELFKSYEVAQKETIRSLEQRVLDLAMTSPTRIIMSKPEGA